MMLVCWLIELGWSTCGSYLWRLGSRWDHVSLLHRSINSQCLKIIVKIVFSKEELPLGSNGSPLLKLFVLLMVSGDRKEDRVPEAERRVSDEASQAFVWDTACSFLCTWLRWSRWRWATWFEAFCIVDGASSLLLLSRRRRVLAISCWLIRRVWFTNLNILSSNGRFPLVFFSGPTDQVIDQPMLQWVVECVIHHVLSFLVRVPSLAMLYLLDRCLGEWLNLSVRRSCSSHHLIVVCHKVLILL